MKLLFFSFYQIRIALSSFSFSRFLSLFLPFFFWGTRETVEGEKLRTIIFTLLKAKQKCAHVKKTHKTEKIIYTFFNLFY